MLKSFLISFEDNEEKIEGNDKVGNENKNFVKKNGKVEEKNENDNIEKKNDKVEEINGNENIEKNGNEKNLDLEKVEDEKTME